jgi:hypothetical protein
MENGRVFFSFYTHRKGIQMQQFIITLKITVNTIETVSPTEITSEIKEYLGEETNFGSIEIESCEEL